MQPLSEDIRSVMRQLQRKGRGDSGSAADSGSTADG